MYKHAFTLTSQIYFCASPIRLDSYNRCQFACVYCFSRERSIKNAARGVREASPAAIEKRFGRVAQGKVASALDEFIGRRVPVQLGGMQDPFSPMEAKSQVTARLLDTLRDYDYPTLISTKGELVASRPYLDRLTRMNVLVRLSAAGVCESARSSVDVRCGSLTEVKDRIQRLAGENIPVSLRIQPVIPGHEQAALDMIGEASIAGARHVSVEFLKMPLESYDTLVTSLSRSTNSDFGETLKRIGTARVGPDYTLATPWKLDFLKRARRVGHAAGIAIGAGDTELIHLSDGGGCCNGSSLFLRNSNPFLANLSGVVSRERQRTEIRFGSVLGDWAPERPVTTYLMTDSRTRDMSGRFSNWHSLLAHRWNGGKGPYSPAFFEGVTWTGQTDSDGLKIYRFDDPLGAEA